MFESSRKRTDCSKEKDSRTCWAIQALCLNDQYILVLSIAQTLNFTDENLDIIHSTCVIKSIDHFAIKH